MLAFSSQQEIIDESAFHSYHRHLQTERRWETIPAAHYGSSARLQQEIMASWANAELDPKLKGEIDRILVHLTRLVNRHCPRKENPMGDRFYVDVFGSVAWGGGTGQAGDLDLVVIDRLNPQGYTPGFWSVPPEEPLPKDRKGKSKTKLHPLNVPTVYNMRRLADYLRAGGMNNVQPVSFATTPIVKFQTWSNIQCDITVNDLGGWYNSSLILAYCNISPFVLRPLVHTLKKWAKMHNVNNPSGDGDTATMSSYCLTLMAIAYLQHMGMLPNLQARVEAPKQHNNADTTDCHDVVWTGWGRYQGTKARIRYDKRPPPGWQPTRSMTASEAVAGFFAYFSQPSGFKYESEILSVLNGGVIKRAHLLGQYAAERKAVRNGLIAEGRSADDVRLTMEAFDMERDARNDPSFMGKGNSDIQPRQWGEKRLVVQDPFIWEKNCAGGMSKIGSQRFLNALHYTNRVIKTHPDVSLSQLLAPQPVFRKV